MTASPIIWTAKGIGREIGRSPDFVRDVLARLPGTPVRRVGRHYFAFTDELVAYFRDNPTLPHSAA